MTVQFYTMKKRPQFLATSAANNKRLTPSFLVLVSTMTDENFPQDKQAKNFDWSAKNVCVGFTASKKVGNAVIRAKVKRRMRAVVDELIRLNPKFQLPKDTSGMNFSLIARGYAKNRNFEKMVKEFRYVLEKELGCKTR